MFNKLRANLSKVGQTRSETFTTSPQEEFIPNGLENVINNTNFMGIQAQNNPKATQIQNAVGDVVGAIQKEVKQFENIRRANEINEYEGVLQGKWLEYNKEVYNNQSVDAATFEKNTIEASNQFLKDIKNEYIDRHGIEKGTFLYDNYFSGIGKGINATALREAEKVRRVKIQAEGKLSGITFMKNHNNSLGFDMLMNEYTANPELFTLKEQDKINNLVNHYALHQHDKEFVSKFNLEEKIMEVRIKYNEIRLTRGSGVPDKKNPDGSYSPDYVGIIKKYEGDLKRIQLTKIKENNKIGKAIFNPMNTKYNKQEWMKRAFLNPSKNIKIIENGKEKFATVQTITVDVDVNNDGTMDVILIPTIREVNGKLVQLNQEEAQEIALEKEDYILITEGKTVEEKRDIGNKLSKEISDGIEIARSNFEGKSIIVDGKKINISEVEQFIENARIKSTKQHTRNKEFTNMVNDRAEANAHDVINKKRLAGEPITQEFLNSILYETNDEGELVPIFKGKDAQTIVDQIIQAALRPKVTFDTQRNDVLVGDMIIRNEIQTATQKFVLDGDVDNPATIGIDESKVGYSLLERENNPLSAVSISSETVNKWYESGSNRTGKKVLRKYEESFNPEFEKLITRRLGNLGMEYKADGTGMFSKLQGAYVAQAIEKLRMQYYKAYAAAIDSGKTPEELNDITSPHYFFDFLKPPPGIKFPTKNDIRKIKNDGRDRDKAARDAAKKKKTGAKNITQLGDDAVKKRKPGQSIKDYLEENKGTP